MKAGQPRGLSVRFCAQAMGVTDSAFRKWVRKGYVRVFRSPGGRIRVPEEELERLMQPQEVPPLQAQARGGAAHDAATAELKRQGIG
jgi:excisionase family DNA binding protein